MKRRFIISLKAGFQQWSDNVNNLGLQFRNIKLKPKHYFEIEAYIFDNKLNKEEALTYRKKYKRNLINESNNC